MLSKVLLCVALGAPVTVVLQGCGGGGDSPAPPPPPPHTTSNTTTTTPKSTTTTTSTTTTFTKRTPGWSLEEAVQGLNEIYLGYDATDESSPVGVTLSYAGQPTTFMENIFCPGYNPDAHCFDGIPAGSGGAQNVCRMSAAILNHKVMVRPQGNDSVVVPLMDRSIGYIFNQSIVDYAGKCTFIFDGAASLNVNQGCGGNAGGGNCEDPNSAFYDMCTNDDGASYHHCVGTDTQVLQTKCNCPTCHPPVSGGIDPPHYKAGTACFYELPALIVPYDDPKSYEPSPNNFLRDAMKQRTTDPQIGNNQQDWNEVILDERLLIPAIHVDPTHTILAFFYVKGGPTSVDIARSQAEDMRDQFQQYFRVSGVGNIPVVELDAQDPFQAPDGPFKIPSGSAKDVVVESSLDDFSDVSV